MDPTTHVRVAFIRCLDIQSGQGNPLRTKRTVITLNRRRYQSGLFVKESIATPQQRQTVMRGMSTEVDLHTPHWHGNTLIMMGMHTDMDELLPMGLKTLDMTPDAVGTWLLQCRVNNHIVSVMQALYTLTE